MSTYTINKTDGSTLVAVPEATINTSACSLSLVGRRAVSYGEHIAENFVKLIENFAHTTAPSNALVGQLWFDKSETTLKVYSGGSWYNVATLGGGEDVEGTVLVSTASTGTAPLIVASTTKVANLNADYVDGYSVPADKHSKEVNSLVIRDENGDIWANTFHGIATSAQYADIAERFEASETLEPGDVVEIGGDKEIEKARGASCLGVISTAPAFRMNDGAGDDETHPFVAFAGRVPCKVTGPVNKGDRLISNGDGTAVAGSGSDIIGRALETKTDDAVSKIMIVVGVK